MRAVLDQCDAAIVFADCLGVIEDFNRAAAQLALEAFGRETRAGLVVHDFVIPENGDRGWVEVFDKVLASQPPRSSSQARPGRGLAQETGSVRETTDP